MKTLHQFDEVFDTQAVFRLLLDAMSNPTRTVSVAAQKEKLFGDYGAFLALGMHVDSSLFTLVSYISLVSGPEYHGYCHQAY